MRITSLQGSVAPQVSGQLTAPQRLFTGVTDASSQMLYWWGPPEQTAWSSGTNSNGTPDHYILYRDGVRLYPPVGNDASTPWTTTNLTGVRDYIWGNPSGGLHLGPPQPFYVDTGLGPNTTHSYFVTQVNASGIEGAASNTVTITTLQNATGTPTLPAPVTLSPDTWIIADALPTGTVWTATNTSNLSVVGPVTPNVDCSLSYALANSNPGDTIICTAGATYLQPVGGWILQAYSGPAFVRITTSEDPLIKSGGLLPPSTYDPTPVQWIKYTCTGVIALGATSATLSAGTPWTHRKGAHYVLFSTGEERLCTFTAPNSIDWSQFNAITDANAQRQGPGLLSAATATIQVSYVNAVTPTDMAAMPTLELGTTGGFAVPAACNNIRFVGIRITSNPANVLQAQCFSGTNTKPPTGTTSLLPTINTSCDHFYVDRCLIGDDSTGVNYRHIPHGLTSINANHLLITQCFFWGIAENIQSPGADAYAIGIANGGPICIQNSYIEAESESMIAGGLYASESQPIADLVWRQNFSHKPSYWKDKLTANVFQNPSPGTALAIASCTAANPIQITMAAPTNFSTQHTYASKAGSYVLLTGFTTGSWVALNNTLQLITAIDSSNFTIPVNGSAFTGATTGGTALSMRLEFANVKNLYELKNCQRAESYGSLHDNCWTAFNAGYQGCGFAINANGNPGTTGNFNSGYPWERVTDINIHDVQITRVGAAIYCFTGGDQANEYTARIRLANAIVFSGAFFADGSLRSFVTEGPVPDITLDHVTFITNSSVTWAGKSPNTGITSLGLGPGYGNPAPYTPNGLHNYQDRLTVTNCIIDSPSAFGTVGGLPLSAYQNLNWTNNLYTLDTTTTNPGTNYPAVPYASVGFQNFTTNTMPPLNPTDWNVVSGPYFTASTTGGPLGASTVGPGANVQITTASLPPATVGVAYSQALSASGGTPPYTWNKVSISPNTLLALTVSPAGVIQGTTQSNETSTIVAQVNDSAGRSAQATLPLASSSSGTLTVVTTTLPNYTQGAMYYGQLIAKGGVAPYVWSGSPPAGVQIQRSGQISVDSSAAGPFSFTATATDAANTSVTSGTLTITVDTVLRFANVDPIDGFIRLPDGYASTLYGQAKPRFMAFGGTAPYTFSVASGNTNGLTVASDGSLSGTPASAGALNFTVQVADSASHTATAPVLLNVLSQDKVIRPAYNTSSGYFVHSDGTFRDPNGYKFIMRGMNRDHYDNACMPSMAVLGPNAIRYTAYTYGVSVAASTYESGMNTDHIGNKEFVFLSGFFVVGTTTQLSGRSTPSDIQGVCNYLNQNIAIFNPIMNKMGLNIANEWGTGNQSLTGNALFLQTYDGALVNITSISGTTINFTSAAGTNPLASQNFGWIQGVSGLTNQTVGLSGAAGTGPNYSITSSVSLGTFGAGGQLGGGAVCALRAAGWTCPIIIDECGRNGQQQGNILGGNAAIVNGHDPQKNCIFNTHQYNVGTPGRAQIASVTTGATTVLHFNNSSATNPFSNVGALPEIGMTLIGMAGGTWPSVNGQTFSIAQGGGSFSGGAGTWAVTIPLNSTGLGAYTAGSGFGFDSYNPAITAKNFAALQAQGVCAMIEEFGPVTAAGPSPTILAPTDIIQAAEAYGIGWFYWAYDDGNPFGLMTTLPAPNFAVSNLSTYAGQALVMHARMNWLALAISPPALLP